jgi:hypothetical protein
MLEHSARKSILVLQTAYLRFEAIAYFSSSSDVTPRAPALKSPPIARVSVYVAAQKGSTP